MAKTEEERKAEKREYAKARREELKRLYPERLKEVERERAARTRAARSEERQEDVKGYMRQWRAENQEKLAEYAYVRHVEHPLWFLVANAKRRAKELNLPFDLREADIAQVERCPALGIELDWDPPGLDRSGPRENAPSIDRLIPEKGYVRGNVCVISHRANRVKSHASIEDLEKILAYMRRELG